MDSEVSLSSSWARGGLIEAALLKQESSSPFDPSPEPEVPFLLVLHELLRRATSEVVDSEEDS